MREYRSRRRQRPSPPDISPGQVGPVVPDPPAYAEDIVGRLDTSDVTSVLEVAAGSGVVTRAMATGLASSVSLTATDLSQPMIDHATSIGTARPVACVITATKR